jgi:hypothetical protein
MSYLTLFVGGGEGVGYTPNHLCENYLFKRANVIYDIGFWTSLTYLIIYMNIGIK